MSADRGPAMRARRPRTQRRLYGRVLGLDTDVPQGQTQGLSLRWARRPRWAERVEAHAWDNFQ